MDAMPRADATPPSPVRRAVALMRIGAAVSALSAVLAVVTYDAFRADLTDQLRADDPDVSADFVEATVAVSITFVVFIAAVSVAIWLWMAWKNGQGRAWARFVATMLGGLNLVFTLFGFIGSQYDGVTLVLQVVLVALSATIVHLLWRPESTAFYDAVSNPHTR